MAEVQLTDDEREIRRHAEAILGLVKKIGVGSLHVTIMSGELRIFNPYAKNGHWWL